MRFKTLELYLLRLIAQDYGCYIQLHQETYTKLQLHLLGTLEMDLIW